MKQYDVIIIGGGPAAIVTGITIKKNFRDKKVLLIKEEAEGLVPCGIPYIFYQLNNDVDKNKMGPKPFIDLGGEAIIKLASTATAEARTLGHNIFGIRIKKCISGTLGVFSTEINGLAIAGACANDFNLSGHPIFSNTTDGDKTLP